MPSNDQPPTSKEKKMSTTVTAHQAQVIADRRQSRMPGPSALDADWLSGEQLKELIADLQGPHWENAVGSLSRATIKTSAGVRAVSALVMEAISRRLLRSDAPTPIELVQAMLLAVALSTDPHHVRLCYQLLLQAERDGKPDLAPQPDRFSDLQSGHPRVVMFILMYTLAALAS